MKELGIYIHIPFCANKCDYCDFISYDNKIECIEQYVECLKKEIKGVAKKYAKKYVIKTIYIGGGTPSFINPIYIEQILNILKTSWKLKKDCEITIEVNPGTVDKEKLETYYQNGINRISVGMQSTDNKILKNIGRIHTFEQFNETYNNIEQVGFENINVDIMIGLPNQTIKDVYNSIDEILKLSPNHISVYSLIVEEGTKLEQKLNNKEYYLPEEEQEREMYWGIKNKLEEAGYIHYEISNFVKKGYESKHNLDCWNQNEYIGFGVASHSYLENKRYSNIGDLNEYIKSAKGGKYEREIHEVQTKEDKAKEYMLLGLRKIEGIKISEFKNKFIDNPLYLYRNEINKLVDQGLIEIDIDNIKLTSKGIDLANLVWGEFI